MKHRKRTPRDYQSTASKAFDAALEKFPSTILVMPTGTGKTVVMADITRRWTQERDLNVLLLAHRVELLDQGADKFADELSYRPEVIQADRPVDALQIHREGGKCVIGSVQTLCRGKKLRRLLEVCKIDLVLIDEVHHAVAPSYKRIIDMCLEENPDCKVGGVTATPNRTDKRALGISFASVAYQMEIGEAVDSGWLVPPCERKVVIDGVDFAAIKLTKNEAGETDFDQADLEARMLEEKPLHAVTEPLLDMAGNRKWIVFAAGVEHGKRIAEILNRAKPGSAEAIDGKNHPPGHPDRIRILTDFCDADSKLQFLCNFGICTEGFDAPLCAGVCIARPTKSITILTQMIGRALRPLDGLVDPYADSASRVHVIEASEKPSALILYFIPKAVNVKVLTVVDALGGNFDDDERDMAKQAIDEEPGAKVLEKLRQAALVADLFRDQEIVMRDVEAEMRKQAALAKAIKAKVSYRTHEVGGHAPETRNATPAGRKGGATEKQIAMLMELGVERATATAASSRQAYMMTESIRKKRCTNKQRAILARFGEDINVPFAEASDIITEIASNGWKPRRKNA